MAVGAPPPRPAALGLADLGADDRPGGVDPEEIRAGVHRGAAGRGVCRLSGGGAAGLAGGNRSLEVLVPVPLHLLVDQDALARVDDLASRAPTSSRDPRRGGPPRPAPARAAAPARAGGEPEPNQSEEKRGAAHRPYRTSGRGRGDVRDAGGKGASPGPWVRGRRRGVGRRGRLLLDPAPRDRDDGAGRVQLDRHLAGLRVAADHHPGCASGDPGRVGLAMGIRSSTRMPTWTRLGARHRDAAAGAPRSGGRNQNSRRKS